MFVFESKHNIMKNIRIWSSVSVCPKENNFELNHVINSKIEELQNQISSINDDGDNCNRKAIIKVMIATLLEEL